MEQSNDHRICFVGDSFVQGTGDPLCLGWTGRLAAQARRSGYDVTYYNLGVRRDTSRDILARWERECAIRLPPGTPNYVVFSFGVNDSTIENEALRISTAESEDNFKQIIKKSRFLYNTLVIGPPPVRDPEHNKRILELSELFVAIAQKIGAHYLPVCEGLSTNIGWMREVSMNDGSHPGELGYSTLAELVCCCPHWWFGTHNTHKPRGFVHD